MPCLSPRSVPCIYSPPRWVSTMSKRLREPVIGNEWKNHCVHVGTGQQQRAVSTTVATSARCYH